MGRNKQKKNKDVPPHVLPVRDRQGKYRDRVFAAHCSSVPAGTRAIHDFHMWTTADGVQYACNGEYRAVRRGGRQELDLP